MRGTHAGINYFIFNGCRSHGEVYSPLMWFILPSFSYITGGGALPCPLQIDHKLYWLTRPVKSIVTSTPECVISLDKCQCETWLGNISVVCT